MFDAKNITLGKVKRSLTFPYQVLSLGYSECNPPLENVSSVFPDCLEINIRLDGNSDSVMVLDGSFYSCKSPHVVIKNPNTKYEFRSIP